MNAVTEKVLQRLNYERLLMTGGLSPKRTRISLPEVMQAAEEEPRIHEVLPAIVVHRPQIISRLEKEIQPYPELIRARQDFFFGRKRGAFYGIEWTECVKAATTFKNYLNRKRAVQKSTMMTLRVSPADLEMLRRLKEKTGARSVSAAILQLARERMLSPL